MVCKSPNKYKRLMLISNFFHLETDFYYEKGLCTNLITWSRLKKTKSENNSVSNHLFFYRLYHMRSFIQPFLNISYRYSFWYKWKKVLINLHSTSIYSTCTKMGWYWRFTINKVNHLLKSFHLQRLMVWE